MPYGEGTYGSKVGRPSKKKKKKTGNKNLGKADRSKVRSTRPGMKAGGRATIPKGKGGSGGGR